MSGNYQIIEELRTRSRALGLDLKEIGRRCGVAETSLRSWERGVAAPSPDVLERWAGALGFRIALLPVDAGPRRGISVDWSQQRIAVDDVPVRLTPMEWKLLERLRASLSPTVSCSSTCTAKSAIAAPRLLRCGS